MKPLVLVSGLLVVLSAFVPAVAEGVTKGQYITAWTKACETERYPKTPLVFSSAEIDAIHVFIHIGLHAGYKSVQAFGGKPTRTLDAFIAEACACAAQKLASRGGDLRRPPAIDTLNAAVRSCTEAVRFLVK